MAWRAAAHAGRAVHVVGFVLGMPVWCCGARAVGVRINVAAKARRWGQCMATVTKKELIDRIADQEDCSRVLVKRVLQSFLDNIIEELSNGNRLEFRDFGVFESRARAPRRAQNPKTLDKVSVPAKRAVRFKVGRVMRERVAAIPLVVDEATGLVVASVVPRGGGRRGSDGKADSST